MKRTDYLILVLALAMVLSTASLSEAVSANFAAPSSGRAVRPAVATAPSLLTAESFAVLAASTVTNTGPTTIYGNVGVSPGSAVGDFPPGVVTGGTIHAADAAAAQAQLDVTAAYIDLDGQTCEFDLTGQDLGGLTLTPGVYCFTTSAQLTGQLTLDGGGDPNAVFVFQTGSTLITASNSSVVVADGADLCNVYWQVGSSATLGTGTAFIGSILASESITLNTGASLVGRALALNGAVTMDTNDISIEPCYVFEAPTAVPTDTTVPTAAPTDTTVPTAAPTDTTVPTAAPTDTTVPTAAPTDTTVPTAAPTDTTVPTTAPTDTVAPTAEATAPVAAPAAETPTSVALTPTAEAVQSELPAAGVAGTAGGNLGGLVAGVSVSLSAVAIWLRRRNRA